MRRIAEVRAVLGAVRAIPGRGAGPTDQRGSGVTAAQRRGWTVAAIGVLAPVLGGAFLAVSPHLPHVHSARPSSRQIAVAQQSLEPAARVGPLPFPASPLWLAVWCGDETRVGGLLGQGADPDSPGLGGWTPLHLAVLTRQHGAVRALLDAGADPNARTQVSAVTPLHVACGAHDAEAICLLVESGAEVGACTAGAETPLHRAVSRGAVQCADALVALGADVNARDGSGQTPLDLARASRWPGMTTVLCEHGRREG